MDIEFTKSYICGEPGPNLYMKGNTSDFFELSLSIRKLSIENNVSLVLPAVVCTKKSIVICRSKPGAKNLKLQHNYEVLVELDQKLWKEVALSMFHISMEPGRIYLDFEEEELNFEGNFIIDSNL